MRCWSHHEVLTAGRLQTSSTSGAKHASPSCHGRDTISKTGGSRTPRAPAEDRRQGPPGYADCLSVSFGAIAADERIAAAGTAGHSATDRTAEENSHADQ